MSISCVKRCTICPVSVEEAAGYMRHMRQVHGTDRLFGTVCPLCDSNFIFTNFKSFMNHFRNHDLHLSSEETPPLSLLLNCNDFTSNNYDEIEYEQHEQQEQGITLWQHENHDSLDGIKKFYLKMLLKIREGHVLPGSVMKTMALSITCLLQFFSYHLLSKLHMNIDNHISFNFNNDVEKTLFEISRNEDSFISCCQIYFKFVKPKEIRLPTGNKAYYIPLRDLLMNLFEKKDFYDSVKQEKEIISQFHEQDIIYHYRNAEIGRQHRILNRKKNCVLLQLYSDDLGVVNPLMGKNAIHKLTTFYISIDDLPACHSSSLSTVYLLLLYYRKDFDDENNRRILFAPLSQDLKSLENDGLILPGDKTPTYFTISTMCADNLATHELGGFTRTFTTGCCCRYCFTHHKDMKRIYQESQTLIRTTESYDIQIRHVEKVPSDKSMYGINEASTLSFISSFHPITSLPPDLMHDVLEGVMPKLTSCLLHSMMSSRLCISSKICQMINKFTYGNNDKRNRPLALKEKDISEKIIRGKAMEKYCLFLNLPFMLFDILDRIPYWFLYELFREIWDILYCDFPRKSWLSTLQTLIEEFLQLFQTIFPEQFTPKFHFLLHSARNTAKYGPLKRQMNLRYEAKHHLLKQIANRCNNFINLPYTISKRVQLRQCYELIDENAFRLNNVSGKIRTRRTITFHKSIQNALTDDSPFIYGDIVEFVKWVLIDNVKYKIGDFFVAHLLGGEEIPLFVKIKFIIHIVKQWRFIVQCYDTITFRQNLWCYEIRPSNNNNILSKDEFLTHKSEDCYYINNSYFIRVPYRLTIIE
ncbi:unnamed protein product [Rotaria socialis]|uniref:C2H2-type domain-containing protein n=1 Tax=Rotaria socialis TaxID=392032 RepID=A0A818BLK7_9BILA|nr:unnamed protein product [Rotaria socialis]CAF4756551.1 unnamed protein product [Rotaria socialis]